MNEREEPKAGGHALIRRTLHEATSSVFTRGEFQGLFDRYADHAQRWAVLPDPLAQVMIRQALGAAALHLACRPKDEIAAWTINFNKPALNLFVTAGYTDSDADHGRVTGRVYTDGVETVGTSRLFVETQRSIGEPIRSTIEITGLDVLQIFEQYYARSVQVPARFFELSDSEYVFIMGLPMTDPDWIKSLERDEVFEILNQPMKDLDFRNFSFECGCSPIRILSVVQGMFRDRPDELFCGEESIQAACPRCGRQWVVTREEFDQ